MYKKIVGKKMKRFKRIYIEITNICNLSCDFCPKTKRKLTMMETKAFEHILKEVRPFTDYIYLHLMGEPTLHPQLEEYLKLSDEAGLTVNLTTNGTLLPKVKDILLNAPALRQVNISLHSFEANKNQETLENYLSNVTQFVQELISQTNKICSIRLWNMDTQELKAKNTLNGFILKFLQDTLNPEIHLSEALQAKKGIKLKKNLYLNMDEKFVWPDLSQMNENQQVFCYGLRDHIGIHVDGTVVPCCLDSEGNIALGNVFKQPLEEIIDSKRAKALYEGFSNRCAVEELCKKCGYAKRY